MSKFIYNGDQVQIVSDKNLSMESKLRPAVYSIQVDPMTQVMSLVQVADFVVPAKIYGDCHTISDRALRTFHERDKATGILLDGEKGSGKSMTATLIATKAIKQGLPVVVVNSPHHGENFNRFIQSIDTPAVIIFDEFDKVYSHEPHQEALLTLLDGVYPSKKLFVLTTNDNNRLSKFLRNRPGRVYYAIEYKKLGEDFVREYCNDALTDKTKTESVVNVANLFGDLNFDGLKALVEEINRYGEEPAVAVRFLNIQPNLSYRKMDYTATVDGVVLEDATGEFEMDFEELFDGDVIQIEVHAEGFADATEDSRDPTKSSIERMKCLGEARDEYEYQLPACSETFVSNKNGVMTFAGEVKGKKYVLELRRAKLKVNPHAVAYA